MSARRTRRVDPQQCAFDFAEQEPEQPRGITLTVDGITLPVIQWAVQIGVSTQTIYARIENGWTPRACISPWVPAPAARKSPAPAGHPGSLSWDAVEWSQDDRAWYAVACHPDGLDVHEVAELQGISTSQVSKLVQRAREKFALALSIAERVDTESLEVIVRYLRGQPVEAFRAAAARDDETLERWARALRASES